MSCQVFYSANTAFHCLRSMLSALRYQQPDLILLHTNCVPDGSYWKTFQRAAGNTLMIIRRSPPQEIFGNTFHVSFFMKIDSIMRMSEMLLVYSFTAPALAPYRELDLHFFFGQALGLVAWHQKKA